MKEIFRIFAEQNKAANTVIIHILDAQSQETREQDRGSYYKSLSGLLHHVLGAELFFAGLFKEALVHNPQASKAIAILTGITPPTEATPDQWKHCAASLAQADDAFISLINALCPDDFQVPVKMKLFGGNPDTVPLSFLLQNLVLHNTHHRGQISQILDELKIDNNYSGISPEVL
ncbi:MAG: damage-inducible protein DinB [Spirochaetaceae bacterium]|nr:damage-inducible protein DinB [Spirochaetaceae bacterium]